jgi:outer membrane receptor for ferrienterochelin and colicins
MFLSPRSLPLFALASFTVGHVAVAGPEDMAGAYGGTDIVSLATGYSRPLFDAPMSASIISRRDIQDSGARNLAELLQTVTSYYVASPDGGRTTNFVVRGLESRVLILVDNVPLYQGLYNGLLGIQDLPLDNVERVEITRGPGSALYGADAVAGIVNIITRTSMGNTPQEVGASVGNLEAGGGYAITSTEVGGFHLSLYGGYTQSHETNRIVQADAQTAFDALFHTHDSLAPGPLDDQVKTVNARVELSNDHWRLRATWHNDFDAGDGIGTAEALDPTGRASSQVGNLEIVYKNALSASWDVSGYIVYTDVEQTDHISLYPSGAFLNQFPQGVRQIIDEDEQRVRGEYTAIYGAHDNRLLMSLGAFTEDAHTTADIRNYVVKGGLVIPTGQFASGAGIGAPLLVGDREDTVVYGVLQEEWSFAPDFSLIAGTRLDDYNHFGSQWSPRAALVWTPTQRATFKLLYNAAFRPPSVTETQSNGTFAALGNLNLSPSKTRMEELQFGYRLSSIDLTASVFSYKTNSLIVTTIDKAAPLGLAYVNGESDKASGLDGEIHWHVDESLTLSLNGMVQRHTSPSVNYYIAESPPRKLINVTADWRFAPGWNCYVSGSGVFEQGRAVSDPRPPPANYGLLNFTVRASELPGGFVATLRTTNVLNKYYVQPSASATAVPYDIPQPGREVTLQVVKSF